MGIARDAAELLRRRGLEPTVVDARFVKPLDTALLDQLAAPHSLIVTIEENALAGGFGSAVLEHLGAAVPVVRFGLPDRFVGQGERATLLAGSRPHRRGGRGRRLRRARRPGADRLTRARAARRAARGARASSPTRAQAHAAVVAGEVTVDGARGRQAGHRGRHRRRA